MTVLYEHFLQQVQRKPEALALVGNGRSFSYHTLNTQINRLANYLRQMRIGQGDIVAIHCGRTPEAIIAILAVQKTGAAYLPFDPLYPPGRLNHMLTDSGAKIIITMGDLADELTDTGAKRLYWDQLSDTLQNQNEAEPPLPTDPRRPFYVIYTSGSTGQPKGASVRYDAFENLVEWYVNTLAMTANDALMLVTSLAFDLTQKNIIAPLITGGTLYLAAEEGFDPIEILDNIPATGTTIMNCTPTHIYTLVDQASKAQLDNLDHLRRLTVGGETLDISRLRRWWERNSFKTTLMNSYGPTECTGIVSYYPIRDPREFNGRPVPISIPIPNASLHVLDENGHPVKPGEQGELHIAGLCVGLGYLHRPELTAERFVACNLPDAKGNVAYRTGDLCLFDTNGEIIFLGRIDQQVKIRGLRIELGEIEAALRDFPGIHDAAVSPVQVKVDDVRIVGYLIPSDPNQPVPLADLRNQLRDNLPDYMIPSQFMCVDAFPKTPSGKLDRKSLPVPDWAQLEAAREIIAPETETEKKLVHIFGEVLGVERVGATDDFFDLGGHSLSALRLLTHIHEQFQVKLGLRTLFKTSSVREMALQIDKTPKQQPSALETPIIPVSHDGWLPLSFAQQRLWFLEQYQPGLTAYNCASAFHITGKVELDILEKTLNEIVQRHAILRTVFSPKDSAPAQRILPHSPFTLDMIELTTLPVSIRETEALKIITEEARHPYSLTNGPLFRFQILKLSDEKWVLAVQLHHIIFDGWSANVLLDEISTLYEAFHTGKPAPLPELAIQYADFATWQSNVFKGETLATSLKFWRKHLGENPPELDLPTDHARPPVQTYCGDTIKLALSPALSEALRSLSRKEGVTLFTTLLAAWRTFLHRYTGQTDIIIGSAVAGRTSLALDNMIGFFVNMLAIRMDLSENPSFLDLLKLEHETTLAAYDNQEIPFDSVVTDLLSARDSSRSPLFQVAFAGQNTRTAPTQFAGLTVTLEELNNKTAKFDLTLYAVDAGDKILLPLEYNTDLFDASTIQRWIQNFQILLEGIVADPHQRIDTLPLISETERQQLLTEWNKNARVPYPRESSIPELFEAEVVAHPDTLAIVTDTMTWTYRELNEKANILAHRLRNLGINTGMFVGLCMERSAEMIAATLGVLKAGAAYVPLDPAYPPARLQYMLNDAQPSALLVSQESIARVGETVSMYPHPVIDVGATLADGEIRTNLESVSKADHLAYIMYTSGSTGTPKGVCIEHRGVVRLVKGLNYASLDASETLFHFAPISFDASTFEIWGALLNGARLVVYPAELPSLKELGDAILRHGVTTLWLTAGLFHQMVESNLASLCDLRQLLAGGDILSVAHTRRVLERIPSITLINGYGPTECTTFTCCHPMHNTLEPCLSVPIGRPISNTSIYILDAELQPVPIGVTGELYVGGDGLARGYLNAPELTAERFIPNPFAPGRLYKTGDLVRYLPDGRVLFLGRADGQIKLRGYRIEPGEIEATLLSHPGVKEAVVMLRTGQTGDKRLAAFAAVRQAGTSDTENLRQYLSDRLPVHMIPTDIIVLTEFPLTPNGKLDRRALEILQPESHKTNETYTPPRDEIETKLTKIWAQLLDLKTVGIHDNFFKLGGHSLLAIRLVVCFRSACGFDISLRDLFECPTVALLADRIKNAKQTEETEETEQNNEIQRTTPKTIPKEDRYLEQLREGSTNPPFLCVTGAGTVTGYYAALAAHMNPTQPFYGLKDPSFDEEYDSFPTVETLARRYIQSVRTIQPHGPYYLGGWCFGGIVAFEMAQQLIRDGEKVALLALIDTPYPKKEKSRPKSRIEHARDTTKSILRKLKMLCANWQICIRYLWDATGIFFQTLIGKKRDIKNQVSPKEYLAWAWHDIHTQAALKKSNLAQPSLRNPRLRLIEDPFVRLVFKTMKARGKAMLSHDYKPYPDLITLIYADDTVHGRKQTLGWDAIAEGGIVTHQLMGGHESILKEPYVSETSKVLQEAIDAALKASNADHAS